MHTPVSMFLFFSFFPFFYGAQNNDKKNLYDNTSSDYHGC